MTEELKPCPLCARDMKCATWVSNAIDSGEPMSAPMCVCGLQGPMYPTRAGAIAAWNTRPTPAATGLREKVAKALTDLATKESGVGLAYQADFLGGASLNLYGKRAEAAKWLMDHADAVLALLPSVIDGREIVEPIQIDREAAAKVADECNPELEFLPAMYRAGELDQSPLCKAFAAQRAVVVEECAMAARDSMVAMDWPPQDGDEQIDGVIATIRALAPSPPEGERHG